jgi:hypothetical protein
LHDVNRDQYARGITGPGETTVCQHPCAGREADDAEFPICSPGRLMPAVRGRIVLAALGHDVRETAPVPDRRW